jgi:4-hydroxy-2-oxoheptanedioate aldolase
MQPARTLKQKLASGNIVTSILITDHLWPGLVEIAQQAGLDYVIVDTEHNAHPGDLVGDVCTMGRMAGYPVLLRPQRTDRESISIAADLGPCGFLLPMIESAAQLDGVRDGLYLPPRGHRRPGGLSNHWIAQYDAATFRTEVEDDFVVFPQIESLAGLERADEIAAHELTTALAAGPFDLAARLGVCGQMQHPKLHEALGRIRAAAERAGKPMWMIGDGPTLAKLGYKLICFGEPSMLLHAWLKQLLDQTRS